MSCETLCCVNITRHTGYDDSSQGQKALTKPGNRTLNGWDNEPIGTRQRWLPDNALKTTIKKTHWNSQLYREAAGGSRSGKPSFNTSWCSALTHRLSHATFELLSAHSRVGPTVGRRWRVAQLHRVSYLVALVYGLPFVTAGRWMRNRHSGNESRPFTADLQNPNSLGALLLLLLHIIRQFIPLT